MLGFLLPTVQILVGVARPSWIAFPYFIMSCAGLFHWSMTGNFAGLSWFVILLQPLLLKEKGSILRMKKIEASLRSSWV